MPLNNSKILIWVVRKAIRCLTDFVLKFHYITERKMATIYRQWWFKNTSIIAITLSLFVRRTCITFSHVEWKFPSMPLTSIALTSILVNRKGTYIIKPSTCWSKQFVIGHHILPCHRKSKINNQSTFQNFHYTMEFSLFKIKPTFSGNFSRFMAASKQSPKSICRIFPLQILT